MTSVDVVRVIDRFTRSRWWLMVAVVIPMAISMAGAWWIAFRLAEQQATIDRLRAALSACTGQ